MNYQRGRDGIISKKRKKETRINIRISICNFNLAREKEKGKSNSPPLPPRIIKINVYIPTQIPTFNFASNRVQQILLFSISLSQRYVRIKYFPKASRFHLLTLQSCVDWLVVKKEAWKREREREVCARLIGIRAWKLRRRKRRMRRGEGRVGTRTWAKGRGLTVGIEEGLNTVARQRRDVKLQKGRLPPLDNHTRNIHLPWWERKHVLEIARVINSGWY